MAGIDAVFSVQTFHGRGGVAAEQRQGQAVADIAAASGVSHVVYSSVGGADRHSGLAHFESKARVEEHLRALRLPATVLRPTFLMDNFISRGPAWIDGRLTLRMALRADTALQMIAAGDVGRIAADAFASPHRYIGHQIEIAGDQLTGPAMAAVFSRVGSRSVRFAEQPLEDLRATSEASAAMFDWFNHAGYDADLPALRRADPELMSLETWLRRSHWIPPTPAQASS
jgi:uncharacterized protein YbjT (DUF2867 family)